MPDHYGTLSGANTYFTDRARSTWTGTDEAKTAALVRASFYIDGAYGKWFDGTKAGGRAQVLAWPRTSATDREGQSVTGIPNEIIYATYEAALQELISPGSMTPVVIPGAVKKRVRVEGTVEVEYATGPGVGTVADQRPVATVIDGLLFGLLHAVLPGILVV